MNNEAGISSSLIIHAILKAVSWHVLHDCQVISEPPMSFFTSSNLVPYEENP
jgi:hypothetical protein